MGTGATAARSEGSRGPDPVLIRLPRNGGTVRAYLYPRLDSVAWSGKTTSVAQVLGFDPEGGALAVVDAKGQPARVDFRLGESSLASKATLAAMSAPIGTDIYGIDPKGTVVRLTRGGTWTFAPPAPARAVFPQSDGSLLIAASKGSETTLWRMHPPDTKLRDTVVLPIAMRGVRAQVGDRVYFATDTALVGVWARNLSVVPSIPVKGHVAALAPTPSGDRVYVAIATDSSIAVVDRYTDKVATTIALPGLVSDLRMDRLGRYVLARPARGDSAWVIAVATNHVIGSVHTKWTDDLPAAAPDGAIALNSGRDVIFVDGETLQPVRTVAGGAQDFWYFTFWNGFRPRAAGVDQPVSFASADSTPSDSGPGANPDSMKVARAPVSDTSPKSGVLPSAAATPLAPRTPPAPTPSASEPFTVSFAALLNEQRARSLADSIQVEGTRARVVASQRAGTSIYRVVLGPFPNRAAADRIGHESQRSYWVFPGQP